MGRISHELSSIAFHCVRKNFLLCCPKKVVLGAECLDYDRVREVARSLGFSPGNLEEVDCNA